MIAYLLAFVGGIWLFQFQPRIPDTLLFALYLGILLCAIPWRPLRLAAWLVIGFAWAHAHALLYAPAGLPSLDLQRTAWVEGQVVGLVEGDAHSRRFVFQAARMTQGGVQIDGDWRLRVSWYRDAPAVAPGEAWRLKLRLRKAAGLSNPGGFDYSRWLYDQGIVYTASVRTDPANGRLARPLGAPLTRLRQGLTDAMAETDRAGRASALLRALVVGDRSGFDDHDWASFSATGTNHLVAISGLHIGLVAGLVGALAGGLWRRIPACCARIPAVQVGVIFGTAAAFGYAALAGFAIPTQRALLMVLVAALILLGGRTRRPVLGLALALALVAAWSPVALLGPGLWLSFVAVAALLWLMLARRDSTPLNRWLRLQLGLALLLAPLLLLFFGQASLAAPLVNLIAIPWFSLVLVPAALLSSLLWLAWPAVGQVAWQGWLWLARPTLAALDQAGQWPVAILHAAPPDGMTLVFGVLGALLLLVPRGVPARWLGVLLLLPLLWRQPDRPPPGAFELTLLDVGQGLSLVVRTARHTLVYDAGPRYGSGFDAGARVVVPALRRQGVTRIDTLLVSHADTDHAGGARALRQALPVARLLSGEPTEVPGASPCLAGQAWQWDGVRFQVLAPHRTGGQGNNTSCVLQVGNGHHGVLLTGDIEAPVERQLLADAGLSAVDAVVVPHHGSSSSSTQGFINALSPAHVLYATGRDNRWGFPRPAVAARWRAQGAQSWNSAHDGAIVLAFPAQAGEPTVRTYRRRHYWHP